MNNKNIKLAVISTHSVVDLITNSSSELFVCNSNKTIETVKEVVETLFVSNKSFIEESDNYSYKGIYSNIDYIWNYIFKPPVVADFEFDPNNDLAKEYYEIYDKRWDLRHKFRDFYIKKHKNIRDDDDFHTNLNDYIDSQMYPYDTKCDILYKQLLIYSENLSKLFGDNRGWYSSNLFIDYKIKVNQGNILLFSAHDNSVPWETWETFNTTLNATNYHLG